jgi:hypothetical protein
MYSSSKVKSFFCRCQSRCWRSGLTTRFRDTSDAIPRVVRLRVLVGISGGPRWVAPACRHGGDWIDLKFIGMKNDENAFISSPCILCTHWESLRMLSVNWRQPWSTSHQYLLWYCTGAVCSPWLLKEGTIWARNLCPVNLKIAKTAPAVSL